MPATGLLILFAILGAFICAKTRSAAGAVVFSLIALVLFVSTPVGQGLPGAISSFMSAVDHASSPALGGGSLQKGLRTRPRPGAPCGMALGYLILSRLQQLCCVRLALSA